MENKHEKYHRLIGLCREIGPVPCAVAHPCDESSLRGALEAAQQDLLAPILVGPEAKIRAVAADCQLDLSGCQIVDAPHSEASAEAGDVLNKLDKYGAMFDEEELDA